MLRCCGILLTGVTIMASNTRTPESCIYEFLNKEFVGSKQYTMDKCRWSLFRSKKHLETAGFDPMPKNIDAEAFMYLLTEAWATLAPSYQESEYEYLKRYVKYFGNKVPDSLKFEFPQDMRINVDWLTDEQYEILLNCPKTPLQDIVIHLELCMGLRNAECCRLTLDDVHSGGMKPYLNVRGKGRGNGKYRTVRFHYDTKAILDRWMEQRAKIVAKVRAYNPAWRDPGTLLITDQYKNKPDSHAFAEHSGSLDDSVIVPLREQLGFHFANHTLRRSFGRRLFHAGVPIETISKFLGHESTMETLKYLGINLDDMDAGMSKLAEYDRKTLSNKGSK
ncbi:MAG: site-specific integrase [Thermoplasmata archaeon]|nr:site-specific integrase [Thermoplasmata archaeon]